MRYHIWKKELEQRNLTEFIVDDSDENNSDKSWEAVSDDDSDENSDDKSCETINDDDSDENNSDKSCETLNDDDSSDDLD